MSDYGVGKRPFSHGWTDDMEVLGNHTIEMLAVTKANGTIQHTRPAPMSREQMKAVWRVVCTHPSYEGQVFRSWDKDGVPIAFQNGEEI